MKFKFSKNLDYQKEAIYAVVRIFDSGKNVAIPEYVNSKQFALNIKAIGAVVQNILEVEKSRALQNLQAIQRENKIEQSKELGSQDFSVEMETGTGKTYVYLRTIFELHQKYALKKFIILVPSVAIREGVLKTIEQTKEHFRELYNVGFGSFAYDSSKLSQVREFAQSLDIQIMIMTIQSFNSDTKVLRQTDRDDTYNESSYLELIAKTKPVIIMDEPQNMESELAKSSIADLNPLFKLRYSATHKEIHNLVYRLTPVDAYKKGLVKKITVFGVQENDAGAFQFKVLSIETKKGKNPEAKVILEVKNADSKFILKELTLKAGDDLARKTKNSKYADLEVRDINAANNRVELSDGNYYKPDAASENLSAIFRTQIHETIKAHFDKQEKLGSEIKVLSLFFIDKVANYVGADSLIRTLFTEEFEKLKKNYNHFKNTAVDSVHRGYFASKKEKGQVVYQDTKGDSKIDKDAYDLIMKDKERLLSFSEPVSFIFSHSALKEGWDNPNIFQICTLKETHSVMKKRQEIGRGLRLCVNKDGDRIFDPQINVLTVVANESYQHFVGQLQAEFTEAGYNETLETTNAREKRVLVKTNKNLSSADFQELWKRISKKTKFNLEVLTDTLIKNTISAINELNISNPRITVERGQIYFDSKNNVQMVHDTAAVGYKIKNKLFIDNLLARIARETNITRQTVWQILSSVDNLNIIFSNPEEYVRSIILIITTNLNNLLINEGLKYFPTNDMWEISLFHEFEALAGKIVPSELSVFDYVYWDSVGEREFAEHLENSPNVKVYTKLPRGFRVDTPLGDYIPDWAIVWQHGDEQKLYLVRETKFGYTDLESQLSQVELQKIHCAKKHFDAINVDFKEVEKSDLADLVVVGARKYS